MSQDVTELLEQLQSSEREKQKISKQLMGKEAELIMAKDTINREQKQRQHKDRELAQAQQQIQEMKHQVILCV